MGVRAKAPCFPELAWTEIEPRLQDLRQLADALKQEFPDAVDFIPRFADLVDDARDAANDDCIEDAGVRITDMLIDFGFAPETHRQH